MTWDPCARRGGGRRYGNPDDCVFALLASYSVYLDMQKQCIAFQALLLLRVERNSLVMVGKVFLFRIPFFSLFPGRLCLTFAILVSWRGLPLLLIVYFNK